MSGEREPWFVDEATDQFLAGLDLAMPPCEPPAGLWTKISRDLAGAAAPSPNLEQRLGEGRWREYAPGVQYKRILGRTAILLRCDPGAVVPPHEHRSFEHTLVISGDLVVDDKSYGAGDYLGTPAGGTHPDWTTRSGCVVLVQYGAA